LVAEKEAELFELQLSLNASKSRGEMKKEAIEKLQGRKKTAEDEVTVQDRVLQDLQALLRLVRATNGMGVQAYKNVSMQNMKDIVSYVWRGRLSRHPITSKLLKSIARDDIGDALRHLKEGGFFESRAGRC
jgi:hypothetical protein